MPDSLISTLTVAVDASQRTSDGGLVWLARAIDRRACHRLAHALLGIYLHERERLGGGRPTHLLLNLDSTDASTHGEQVGSSYHGYHRQNMYHPLLIFDRGTD